MPIGYRSLTFWFEGVTNKVSVIDVDRLIALRKAKGWDQKHLAEAAGIDRSVISRLERRLQKDCRLSVLVAIAAALETPTADLIQATNTPELAEFIPEFEAILIRVRRSSNKTQRQAALLLKAFLDGLDY